jgi:hypothetical protein
MNNTIIMPEIMYTLEVYKKDKRSKLGERLVLKKDYVTDNLSMLEHTVKHTWLISQGFRYVIHKTMVTRTNIVDGVEYQERYDTPFCCSPSSETYWSM